MPVDDNGIKTIINRYNDLKVEKEPWNNHWQLLGEYILLRKQDFTVTHMQGDFLTEEVFDSTAPDALEIMSSALIGALWPNGAKSFRLNKPRSLPDTKLIRDYYDEITRRLAKRMDEPKAGLAVALEEYMEDQGGFGTSGIGIFENDTETPIIYQPWDIKRMVIAEGKNGIVDTVYFEREISIDRAMKEYGREKLSEDTRKRIDEAKWTDKIRILIAIEPRLNRDLKKADNQNKPWQSVHIEIDKQHKIKESGFDSMPVKVGRFKKKVSEKYGRCPAMKALPDVLELNAIWESVMVAMEKALDPPLAVLDDGKLGAGKIDTSAGAINVLNVTGRIQNENPIFPLYTVGDIKQVEALINKREDSIARKFHLDRLLDLNNENEMTLGEAQIRNRLRAATLRSMFSRQIMELFDPLVERSFDIIFATGELGVIPGSLDEMDLIERGVALAEILYIPPEVAELMARGHDVYEIEYITPAMQMLQTEEAEGIVQMWDFLIRTFPTHPEVSDNMDTDESFRILRERLNAPPSVQKAKKEVEKVRRARQELNRQKMQLEAAREASEAARNFRQAQPAQQGAAA